ncbi:hypothetical protein C7J99_06615 [Brevibacillus brevis]|nr:hypothetical protein C7J99_06615 [Brevibacillus brevis]GEC88157.1 hypothetical protein BBR01nite_04880 [Brevibacillus brevis]
MKISNDLERVLLLKPFEYDGENDNRWSWTYDQDHIQINICLGRIFLQIFKNGTTPFQMDVITVYS